MKLNVFLASVFLIAACKREKSNVGKLEDIQVQDTSISKSWNFSLMPTDDYKHNDNDTIKGFVSSDFGVGIGEFKNISLIENGNEITGYCNTFYIEGSRKGDSVYLSVYEHKDGPFSEHEKYLEVSKMRLQYSPISNGILKGKGQHTVNRANDGNDEYDVYAKVGPCLL